MALKIIKANDSIEVKQLVVCIYAPPGVGKSTLGNTADSPLTLDFDHGLHRSLHRKDSIRPARWGEAAELTADDLEPYKTIVMDTAGRALDMLSLDIIADNPKAGKKDGSLSFQGFGVLKARFAAYSKMLKSFGKDLVEICHMDEQRNGDDVIERLDAQGGSKNEIYKSADAMGRIFVRNGKRCLDFSPRDGSFGKNPGQLPELEIPHPDKNPHFLADVIADIKSKLNQMSADQLAERQRLDDWTIAIDDLGTIDDFNLLLPNARKAPEAVKMYLHAKATKMGFSFDKTLNRYVDPKQEPLYA